MIRRIRDAILMIYTMCRGEVTGMAEIYVALIIKGRRTYASVPARLKEQVKQILIDLELEALIEE